MKKKLIVLALLAGGSMFAKTRFSFGVTVGDGYSYPYSYYQTAPAYGYGYGSSYYYAPSYDYRHFDRDWNDHHRRFDRDHDRDDRFCNNFRDDSRRDSHGRR
jgi:hypothetical protein